MQAFTMTRLVSSPAVVTQTPAAAMSNLLVFRRRLGDGFKVGWHLDGIRTYKLRVRSSWSLVFLPDDHQHIFVERLYSISIAGRWICL